MGLLSLAHLPARTVLLHSFPRIRLNRQLKYNVAGRDWCRSGEGGTGRRNDSTLFFMATNTETVVVECRRLQLQAENLRADTMVGVASSLT